MGTERLIVLYVLYKVLVKCVPTASGA